MDSGPNVKLWRPSWQTQTLEALVEMTTKSQRIEILWQNHAPKVWLWRLSGKPMLADFLFNRQQRLWLNLPPRVKLWRLHGKAICRRVSDRDHARNRNISKFAQAPMIFKLSHAVDLDHGSCVTHLGARVASQRIVFEMRPARYEINHHQWISEWWLI